MEIIFESFHHLTDPEWIMKRGGLYLVLIILFIETGLFFGFFLPGDPLLFISGMIIAGAGQAAHIFPNDIHNLLFWQGMFIVGAVLGNFTGYGLGLRFGYLLVNNKKDYWLLKRKHMESAQLFYEKRGGFAITIARFLPIARTFVPVIGGMVGMNFRKFTFYNILGAIVWVGSLVSLGYILGENEWVNQNLEWVLGGIVLFVTLPVLKKILLPKRTRQ